MVEKINFSYMFIGAEKIIDIIGKPIGIQINQVGRNPNWAGNYSKILE
jgi:hypothetical protein